MNTTTLKEMNNDELLECIKKCYDILNDRGLDISEIEKKIFDIEE